jgi:FAD synthase
MIFEPQPLELFAGDKSPARLTRLREKLRYLAESAWTTCCVYVSIVALPR